MKIGFNKVTDFLNFLAKTAKKIIKSIRTQILENDGNYVELNEGTSLKYNLNVIHIELKEKMNIIEPKKQRL